MWLEHLMHTHIIYNLHIEWHWFRYIVLEIQDLNYWCELFINSKERFSYKVMGKLDFLKLKPKYLKFKIRKAFCWIFNFHFQTLIWGWWIMTIWNAKKLIHLEFISRNEISFLKKKSLWWTCYDDPLMLLDFFIFSFLICTFFSTNTITLTNFLHGKVHMNTTTIFYYDNNSNIELLFYF